MPGPYNSTAYRYPNEQLTLLATVVLVFLVIGLTATATVCLSAVFVCFALVVSYISSKAHHQELLQKAEKVTKQNLAGLVNIVAIGQSKLQVEPVDVFVVGTRSLNAYTFGLSSPKAVVLHASLFDVMDRDEISFIVGHELGHVRLGHTWLNSLVGGMAGIPSSIGAAAILELAFRWWNRACEYSADRAGLLACGKPAKAVSALIKLEAGVHSSRSQAGLEKALQRIEAEDDNLGNVLNELLATHPMIARRIDQIRRYAATPEYQRLQALLNTNVPSTQS